MTLIIPEKILEQHGIWLGKTGAGKSSSMRHVVEYLLYNKKRVCIIDPKGEWYGLKSSADGKSAGFPIVTFGNFKEPQATDVPLNERSGTAIAELVASGNRPCIIGLRGWTITAQTRFWIDFASTIFNSNTMGGLKLFIDEVQNFAPKERTGIGEENLALHWTKRLLSEGRGIGLAVLCGSQRPASVHNGVLTQCETLFAMRVIHKSDRKAVVDWIEGCGDVEKGKLVLDNLAKLKRREAFVWSPEAQFGPEQILFPMFETFDSFAPPQARKRIAREGWAGINLDDIKQKLADIIEQEKLKNPDELKKQLAAAKQQIVALEKKLVTALNNPAKTEPKEIPVFSHLELGRLAECVVAVNSMVDKQKELAHLIIGLNKTIQPLHDVIKQLNDVAFQKIRKNTTPQVSPITVLRVPARTPSSPLSNKKIDPLSHPAADSGHSNGRLPIGERKILEALIQYPDGLIREQLTVLTGYKRSSRDTYIQRLREKGFIAITGDKIIATSEGIAAVPDAAPLPSGEELQKFWLNRLPQGERVILEILIQHHPDAVSKDKLSELTNYQRSSRDTYLQRMRAKLIIEEPERGMVRASDNLF